MVALWLQRERTGEVEVASCRWGVSTYSRLGWALQPKASPNPFFLELIAELCLLQCTYTIKLVFCSFFSPSPKMRAKGLVPTASPDAQDDLSGHSHLDLPGLSQPPTHPSSALSSGPRQVVLLCYPHFGRSPGPPRSHRSPPCTPAPGCWPGAPPGRSWLVCLSVAPGGPAHYWRTLSLVWAGVGGGAHFGGGA